MNEEWVAQIDGARCTGCQLNLTIFRRSVSIGGELPECRSRVAIRQQLSCSGRMRPFPYSCRRIGVVNIGKQEEHQQSASSALHIGAPLHEIRIVVAKAHVHMPAIVTRGFRRGKADQKGSESFGRKPAAITDELIVGFVQKRRVGGFNEGRRGLGPHPNNWLNPGFGFVSRQTNIRPQLVPALLCKLGAEGTFDFDETIIDEVLDLIAGQAGVVGIGHFTFSIRPADASAQPF